MRRLFTALSAHTAQKTKKPDRLPQHNPAFSEFPLKGICDE